MECIKVRIKFCTRVKERSFELKEICIAALEKLILCETTFSNYHFERLEIEEEGIGFGFDEDGEFLQSLVKAFKKNTSLLDDIKDEDLSDLEGIVISYELTHKKKHLRKVCTIKTQ